MSKSNKGTIQTWLPTIIGIVIVLLLGGGILAWQYWWTPGEEVETPEEGVKEEIEDEAAGWKTYRNEEYGFEVKYPENSKIVNVNKVETRYKSAKYEKNIFHLIDIQDINDTATQVGIYVNADDKNLKNCLKTVLEDQDLTETIEINGVKFYIYENDLFEIAMGGFRARISKYHTIYNDRCYQIETIVHWGSIGFSKGATTGGLPTQEEIEEQDNQIAEKKAMVDNIVSTFRFLD